MEVRESRETQRAAQAGLGGARRGSEHGISSAAGRVGAKGASPREKQDLVQVKRPHKTKDDGAQAAATHSPAVREGPLGPLGFACAQHRRTSRPSVERIRRKALLPSVSQQRISRIQPSSAEGSRRGFEGFSLRICNV